MIYRQQCLRLREELRQFILEENCAPLLVRLAWHDSGTYDASVPSWPECGGANGSIRYEEVLAARRLRVSARRERPRASPLECDVCEQELAHGANAGLKKAVTFLTDFKGKYPAVSWADLIQAPASPLTTLLLLTTCYPLLTYSLPTAYYSRLPYCSLLATCYLRDLPLTAHYLLLPLLATYCSLLATYCSLPVHHLLTTSH